MRKLSDYNKKTLLVQLHKDIDEISTKIAKNLSKGKCDDIIYPPAPNAQLSEEEKAAVKKIKNIPGIESALKKIIRDSHSYPLFNLFNFIDGTGDPAGDKWTGVSLLDLNIDDDEGKEFLHDGFFETYWDYKK